MSREEKVPPFFFQLYARKIFINKDIALKSRAYYFCITMTMIDLVNAIVVLI